MIAEPLNEVAPQESSPPAATILVIEDDESQTAALEHRLRKLGFRVYTAPNGRLALERAFQQRPDLVLLDLRLPDMDGLDVCAALADAPETCGTPVVILSAFEGPDIVRRARSAGSQYYLRKPFDPNVLLALIERTLRGEAADDW